MKMLQIKVWPFQDGLGSPEGRPVASPSQNALQNIPAISLVTLKPAVQNNHYET